MLIKSLAEVPPNLKTAVTFGKFDGVHLGHKYLIEQLANTAKDRGLASVVISLDKNPLLLLRPELEPPAQLLSNEEKNELLLATGIDYAFELEVNQEMIDTTAEEFVRKYFVEAFGAELVMVSSRTRFGNKARGNLAFLESIAPEYGFEVLEAQLLMHQGEPISSSRIREGISAGELAEAEAMLGRVLSPKQLSI